MTLIYGGLLRPLRYPDPDIKPALAVAGLVYQNIPRPFTNSSNLHLLKVM